jgi:hypothetical protein
MKRILYSFLFFAFTLNAQIQQNIRVEYDEDFTDALSVAAYEKKKCALVMYSDKQKSTKKQEYTVYETLDENLKKKKSISVAEPDQDKYRFSTAYNDESFHYSMYYTNTTGEFLLQKLDPLTLEIKEITGFFGSRFLFNSWVIEGDIAYIAGTLKRKLRVFTLDLNTGKIVVYNPQEKTKLPLSLVDMQKVKTPAGYEIFFRYDAKVSKKNIEKYMYRFDEKGNQIGDFLVLPKPNGETMLLDATFTKVADGSYIVTGTFSKDKKVYANGLYFAKLTDRTVEYIKYTNFLDIKNFIEVSGIRKDKLAKKQEKAEEKGEELFVNSRATLHDVIEVEGKYFVIAEFFYPTYRTETYTATDANGRMVTRTRQVFDGYQYSHAAIASYKKDGTLAWSNAFEMWLDSKPFGVTQFIRVGIDGMAIKMMYSTGSQIKSIAYSSEGKVISERKAELVNTSKSKDEVKYTMYNDLHFWYDNHFITYGFQKIKNEEEDEKGKKKRKVYYINKITF